MPKLVSIPASEVAAAIGHNPFRKVRRDMSRHRLGAESITPKLERVRVIIVLKVVIASDDGDDDNDDI